MAKFDEEVTFLTSEMSGKLGIKNVDVELLKAIAKSQGPAIYKEDAKRVSCSDKVELERVKNNFLVKKLGLENTPKLDEAIKEVCAEFGSNNKNKFRVIFYYLLTKKLNKTSVFN